MFHSILKALLFCSAMLVVVDASTVAAERALGLEQPDNVSLLKPQGGAAVGVVTGDVLVKAWTAVNVELSTCHNVVQQPSTSIEVAIQAVAKVSTLIQTASQSAQCSSCSGDKEIQDKLRTVLVTFFTEFQIILQACSKHYSDVWTVKFKDPFQQCSNGFTVIASICASLQIDLQGIISSAHLDASLFAAIGLDLLALLKVN